MEKALETVDPIKFPRGIESWLETHYQIVEFIGYNQSRYANGALVSKGIDLLDDLDGQGAKQEFAEALTTKFEEDHKVYDFEDGDQNFYERLDEFLEKEIDMENLKQKLEDFINTQARYADKDGSTSFATCSHSNWDRDIWNHKDEIIGAIRKRGYKVSSSTSFGVLDVVVRKDLDL